MSVWPRTTFARTVALLALTLIVAAMLSLMALRRLALEPGAREVGRLIAALIETSDRELAAHGSVEHLPAELQRLGVRLAARPADTDALRGPRFLNDLIRTVASELGGAEVVATGGERTRIWVESREQPGAWIGVEFQELRRNVIDMVMLTLGMGALLALLAASVFARQLDRPLRRLAQAAPALVRGEPAALPPSTASTEVQRLAAALQEAGIAHARAQREREILLAGISHDLRTPLSRIRWAVELMDEPRHLRLLDGMRADVDEIDTIIGQFIDFVRGGGDEPVENIDLAGLIDECVIAARRGGVLWLHQGCPSEPVPARPRALARALTNLMQNAQRHASGRFEIGAQRLSAGEIAIDVRDHGPGLPEADLERLLQPFVQGEAARSGPGSGLGLAVAQRIAQLHGGSLQLANCPDGGLRARLIVPAG